MVVIGTTSAVDRITEKYGVTAILPPGLLGGVNIARTLRPLRLVVKIQVIDE